jgi:DegV family protein with EDD domain
MSPPAVLLIDPEGARRKDLARGLSGCGYEVVPAVDGEEGMRFAEGLGPGIVVAPAAVARSGESPLLARFSSGGDGAARHTLLLLGRDPAEGEELPEEVLYLVADGLPASHLVRRIHLVLAGREIGLEPDAGLESLVGDFTLLPLLGLLRDLHRLKLSARIVCAEGEVGLEGGEVVAASAGHARGMKAFFRLSRLDAGPFWLQLPESPQMDAVGEPEIREGLKQLIIRALEDRVHDAPDPRTRIRVQVGQGFFETRFTPRQQEILTALSAHATIGRLLDALPDTDGEILRDLVGLRELGIVTLEEPQDLVRVVTDSTADLPPELARVHGIRVVPLRVLFGDQIFQDGVDLRPREFYERLEKGEVHPRTSPPLKGDFLNVYRPLAGRKDLISLHLSGKLSQTLENARAAVTEGLPDFQAMRGPAERVTIKVVDSGSVSLGLGMLAVFAARLARRGIDLDGIAERLEAMRPRMHTLFAVNTLEYLARGGRIGKARALMGNLLGIKPILGVVDGEVVSIDRVRGGRAAQPRLIELFRQRVDPGRPVVVSIAHAKAPVWADRLRVLFEQSFGVAELFMAEMGPVVGTHAGPGTVGAALFQPTEEELPLVAPLQEPV